MPEGPLSNRVILVTGGGRGIGRAHCLALAEQGAAVVVNDPGVDRDGRGGEAGPAADVVAEIEKAGGNAVAHTGSVSVWADVVDMVNTAVDAFGTLTGVVNNAGIVRDAMLVNTTEADWDAVIGVHLKGTFAVTKHACEYWRAQSKAGNQIDAHVVNTVSGAGLWGNVGQCAYGAAKAAIANLTVVAAMEARRYGVAVNAISPIAVTRLSADVFTSRADDRAMDPARSSAVVAWLQSPESSWLTGQILRVDGDKLIRIEGFTEIPHRYHANDGVSLHFSEVGQAVSWLYGTSPRGLTGPLRSPRLRAET
ncbi:short-chain dehydrogenase [Mycobacterium paraintracellulare]|uniref:SDR family NAD(P)-dependent oxidoreductase n=1 Tax=Mycobacterium paraintracellulare TaxID=1138383 RepID=UPI001927D837|nr:SDR family NAD(P)-dependent oxidoreductase [Mycobacterium paraintracellulare]BCP08027.1 short-chain dehydrogenase [Mycobacterium paraintracellulare]